MRYMFALALTVVLPGLVAAGDSEEVLRFYLAKSDVVVVGEFTSEPGDDKEVLYWQHCKADFKISEIIKWDAPLKTQAGRTIKVNILLAAEEQPPELKKGGKCMLFLESYALKPTPSYITADIWFGLQRPSPVVAKALTAIVTDQNKTPLRVPAGKDIDQFYPDPPRDGGYFKNFKIDRAGLVKILDEYHMIPKYDWTHGYSHVGQGDRTGTIVLRDSTKIQYMVRPGGLATLTFIDGRKLYLTSTK